MDVKPQKSQFRNNPDYICNPQTGKWVLKSGPTGQKLLSQQNGGAWWPFGKKTSKMVPEVPVLTPPEVLDTCIINGVTSKHNDLYSLPSALHQAQNLVAGLHVLNTRYCLMVKDKKSRPDLKIDKSIQDLSVEIEQLNKRILNLGNSMV